MITGPKYKIARRLGANIYEKTQTAKFALRQERKAGKGPYRPKGQFATQMLEKQKARLSYGMGERQFKKYVKESVAQRGNTTQTLFVRLESRLDNVIYRLGFASTRLGARQMISHGHITVDGKKVTIASYSTVQGEKVSVRASSMKKALFAGFDEKLKTVKIPAWLSYDAEKRTATVESAPKYAPTEHLFNLGQVIEFYSR